MLTKRPALAASIRGWQVWTLRPVARAYVLTVVGLDLAVTLTALIATHGSFAHLGTYLALLGCAAVVVETVRRVGEVKGTISRDMYGVWYLPMAVLCPLGLVLLAPILVGVYRLVRIRRVFPYRRVFSDAAMSLANGAAAIAFHAAPASVTGPGPGTGEHAVTWAGLAAGCAVLRWLVNNTLIHAAIWLATPEVPLRQVSGGRTALMSDVLEAGLSVIAAFVVAVDPVLMLLVLPVAAFCQRSNMAAQLVSQTRVDATTGLLTATLWRYEADVEASEALREHRPLTIALAEVDDFGGIGEMAGPEPASEVLRAVAASLADKLPATAQVGRLAGAKFAIVLPGTTEQDARHLGERIRDHVGGQAMDVESGGQLYVVRPTVSIGMASLAGPRRTLTELIAAADAVLARARTGGGNRVGIAGRGT